MLTAFISPAVDNLLTTIWLSAKSFRLIMPVEWNKRSRDQKYVVTISKRKRDKAIVTNKRE